LRATRRCRTSCGPCDADSYLGVNCTDDLACLRERHDRPGAVNSREKNLYNGLSGLGLGSGKCHQQAKEVAHSNLRWFLENAWRFGRSECGLWAFEVLQKTSNCASIRSRLLKDAHERRHGLDGRFLQGAYTGTACFHRWNLAKWPGL